MNLLFFLFRFSKCAHHLQWQFYPLFWRPERFLSSFLASMHYLLIEYLSLFSIFEVIKACAHNFKKFLDRKTNKLNFYCLSLILNCDYDKEQGLNQSKVSDRQSSLPIMSSCCRKSILKMRFTFLFFALLFVFWWINFQLCNTRSDVITYNI